MTFELKHLAKMLKDDEATLVDILEKKTNKDIQAEQKYFEGELLKINSSSADSVKLI